MEGIETLNNLKPLSMKYLLIVSILFLLSCSKKTDTTAIESCNQEPKTYSSSNGTELYLTQQQWYLNRIGNGGSVNLRVSGSITGDSATIRSYGDGLISDVVLDLDSDKKFEKDLTISFNATSLTMGDIVGSTVILVYRNSDTLKAELKGCVLRF